MDDADVAFAVDNEAQFWTGLDDIVAAQSSSHEEIDDALRSFLAFTTTFKHQYLQSEYDIAQCCYRLLSSQLYKSNQDYVRRQFLYCLLQEEDVETLHLAAAMLLFDGRGHETAFEMMLSEFAFPRLVELIGTRQDDESGLHRLLLELLFEMSRIQKLTRDDLASVDDNFILYLLQLIEELSDDADDPYHYPVIRVLLVLNEQYMCFANTTSSPTHSGNGLTNRILKLLSTHGPSYRTFGENLILLLNRESQLGPQILILKLFYLLFTTPPTYEYFYTNDLHVLVDVIIRNLLDLDPGHGGLGLLADGGERDGQRALRHTYLRVLCPLLKNTQLARANSHYKREELRRTFFLLVNRSSAHFAPVDETVTRLVARCKQVEWIREDGDEPDEALVQHPPMATPTESEVANKLLGISLNEAGVSSLSVAEVSAKVTKEKPTIPAPRRGRRAAKSNGSHASEISIKVPTLQMKPAESDKVGKDSHSPFADDNAET